ncbi:Sister chromatid cohesion protein DCC1, partial [Metarhizium majus ARSEF 297]|uniref:Sister chromatid cohesion protein DCC1 n=1 Tax=Metarhizium guizhouense (strain ARSEF 977) TaxID=1276136 RepID=A0A0B4H6J0_METGA
MSSQSQGIKLIHNPDSSGYRLLELPPDLVNLLESDTAPVLTLESSDSSTVLRTPSKTYNLRQKNTSNGLYLLAPHSPSDLPDQELAVISTIHETVELDVVPEMPARQDKLADTGSRGKWHEMFGRGR